MTQGVNPLIGEVAVPGGRVMQLNTRALVWTEEALGVPIQAVVLEITMFQAGARTCSTILWAGIEAARRRRGDPGPEFTLQEAEALIDEHGLLAFQGPLGEAVRRSQAIRRHDPADDADIDADPQEAASSTGENSSPPPSTPESTSSAAGT